MHAAVPAGTSLQQQQFRPAPSLYHDPPPFAMISVQLPQKASLLGLAVASIWFPGPIGQGLTC